jgi:ELMO domain-containing protein
MQSLLEEEPPSRRDVIPYAGPFNLQKFLVYVVTSWQGLYNALQTYLKTVVGGRTEIVLSDVQLERLEKLRDSISVPYDGSRQEHQEALRKLWALAFPHIPCTVLKTAQWKEMGWQGDDPGTDFRGAGLYGLENLMYLGNEHPALFKKLMHKTDGRRAEWEYPFAVAGLNITFMLVDLLDLQGRGPPPQTAAGQSFMALLERDAYAFEEVYCQAYQVLDRTWLDLKASYMEFSTVMGQTKAKVDRALASKPASLQDLSFLLLGSR